MSPAAGDLLRIAVRSCTTGSTAIQQHARLEALGNEPRGLLGLIAVGGAGDVSGGRT